jgi:hypothetical protein
MVASFCRRALGPCLVLLAAPALVALSACSPVASSEGGSIRFAVSTTAADVAMVPSVRVREVRALSGRLNLREPVLLGSDGADVTVTFAHRQREGETLTIVPTSLEARAAVPYSYPASSRGAALPTLDRLPSSVALDDGGSLSCWTDEASGRVLVQALDATGASRGSPVPVSPEGMAVFGAPHVATSDGRHVVAVFIASDQERFQLVAASLEQTH